MPSIPNVRKAVDETETDFIFTLNVLVLDSERFLIWNADITDDDSMVLSCDTC